MNKKILIGSGIFLVIGLILATTTLALEESSPPVSSCFEIKTSTLNLELKDIKEAREQIFNLTAEKNGWVKQDTFTQTGETSFSSITVQVPLENFEEALTSFKELGEKVTYEKTESQDVRQEYSDLETRLKNLEETESQLLKLAEKKGTIPEVLEVQKELTKIREETERIEEERQCFERKVKMATLNLNIGLSAKPLHEGWRQADFLNKSLEDLLTFLSMIGYFVIEVIVWAVVWVPVLLIVLYLKKRWRKPVKL